MKAFIKKTWQRLVIASVEGKGSSKRKVEIKIIYVIKAMAIVFSDDRQKSNTNESISELSKGMYQGCGYQDLTSQNDLMPLAHVLNKPNVLIGGEFAIRNVGKYFRDPRPSLTNELAL